MTPNRRPLLATLLTGAALLAALPVRAQTVPG